MKFSLRYTISGIFAFLLVACSIQRPPITVLKAQDNFTPENLKGKNLLYHNSAIIEANYWAKRHNAMFAENKDFYKFYDARLFADLEKTPLRVSVVENDSVLDDIGFNFQELSESGIHYLILIDSIAFDQGSSPGNMSVNQMGGVGAYSGGQAWCSANTKVTIWSVETHKKASEFLVYSSSTLVSNMTEYDRDYETCIRRNADELAKYLYKIE